MSDISRTVTMTCGYGNTEFTRKYKVDDVAAADLANVKSKALALNASIAAGTDNGLSDFFRSDDYDDSDSNNVIGKFTGIVALQSESVEEYEINLNE